MKFLLEAVQAGTLALAPQPDGIGRTFAQAQPAPGSLDGPSADDNFSPSFHKGLKRGVRRGYIR